MSNKLHIPGSADEEDLNELNMVLVLGWAVCMLLCIALFLFFRERRPDPAPLIEGAQAAAGAKEEPKTELDQTIEAFRFGPREVAEKTCENVRPQLTSGALAAQADEELAKVVARGAQFAPWGCLMGAYINGEVSRDLQVHAELEKFWEQTQFFYAAPDIVATFLKYFYQNNTIPQPPEFTRWLRLCGMTQTFRAQPACLRVLAKLAPDQGVDVLDMVEKHLQMTDAKTLATDMPRVAHGMGNFSADGQPGMWHIEQSEKLPNYNADLRVGAAFMLCRVVNSPDEKAARAASLGLAKAANMGARAADSKLVRRWRETCKLAFHLEEDAKSEETPEEVAPQDAATIQQKLDKSTPTPVGNHFLAVWNGDENSPPDYTLRGAIERGHCTKEDGLPAWHCGLKYWRGDAAKSFDLNLQSLFVKTSYIEWLD